MCKIWSAKISCLSLDLCEMKFQEWEYVQIPAVRVQKKGSQRFESPFFPACCGIQLQPS